MGPPYLTVVFFLSAKNGQVFIVYYVVIFISAFIKNTTSESSSCRISWLSYPNLLDIRCLRGSTVSRLINLEQALCERHAQ
jgi:hypothetical protein